MIKDPTKIMQPTGKEYIQKLIELNEQKMHLLLNRVQILKSEIQMQENGDVHILKCNDTKLDLCNCELEISEIWSKLQTLKMTLERAKLSDVNGRS
ncbi:MAG: hypothetical protein WCT77_08600 [Bacteroidota bacterium]|jgi:hypothetical protein